MNRTHDLAYPILQATSTNPMTTTSMNVDSSIRISVHLRHVNQGDLEVIDNEPFERKIMEAIVLIRQQFANKPNCYVYIASNRDISILRLSENVKSIKCTPFAINRTTLSGMNEDDDNESGKWMKGLVSVADWYLLQHGDVFIGTSLSAYSLLIANSIAYNGIVRRNFNVNNLLWVDYSKLTISSSYGMKESPCSCLNGTKCFS